MEKCGCRVHCLLNYLSNGFNLFCFEHLSIVITAEQISISHAPIFTHPFLLHALHTHSSRSSSEAAAIIIIKYHARQCAEMGTYIHTNLFRINGYWQIKLFSLYYNSILSYLRTVNTYKIFDLSHLFTFNRSYIYCVSLFRPPHSLTHSFNL